MENFPDLPKNDNGEDEPKVESCPMEKAFMVAIGLFIVYGGYLYIFSTYVK